MKHALFAFALVACSRSAEIPTTAEAPDPKASATSPLAGVDEIVTATVDDWTSTKATLRRFRRDGERWKLVGKWWQGVVGKNGVAWGIGMHGSGAPSGRPGPLKREGDGKSPAGVFSIGRSYGYAANAPAGSKLRYTPVDTSWKCVDDPASSHYNQILDQRTTTVDWKSAEEMRRDDALYAWVVDLGHNTSRTPSGGSCIFFHVWRDADGATLGCTAMPEPVLAELIATLDPSAAFVLLPLAEYQALAPSWGLPH